MGRCAGCGYVHEQGSKCPLCACGKLPEEHLPVTEPPSPAMLTRAGRTLLVCPGKPRSEAGKLPTVRRGSFRDAPEAITWRRRADGVYVPVQAAPEAADEPMLPPRVPARLTAALSEIAPRAMPLGNLAADLGWQAVPWYWIAGDGTETSALVLRRGTMHAAAYWTRTPGANWRTAGARAWLRGDWPREIGVTALVKSIEEMGRDDHQEG